MRSWLTDAIKSVFDDSFQMIFSQDYGQWELIAVITIHVDDLLLCASASTTQWIENLLTERFGTLTKQTLPFVHTGLQLEMINHECLRLHQDDFNSKLKTHDWTKDGRKYQAEELCTPEEAERLCTPEEGGLCTHLCTVWSG